MLMRASEVIARMKALKRAEMVRERRLLCEGPLRLKQLEIIQMWMQPLLQRGDCLRTGSF
jgi:hypothetical protein